MADTIALFPGLTIHPALVMHLQCEKLPACEKPLTFQGGEPGNEATKSTMSQKSRILKQGALHSDLALYPVSTPSFFPHIVKKVAFFIYNMRKIAGSGDWQRNYSDTVLHSVVSLAPPITLLLGVNYTSFPSTQFYRRKVSKHLQAKH